MCCEHQPLHLIVYKYTWPRRHELFHVSKKVRKQGYDVVYNIRSNRNRGQSSCVVLFMVVFYRTDLFDTSWIRTVLSYLTGIEYV